MVDEITRTVSLQRTPECAKRCGWMIDAKKQANSTKMSSKQVVSHRSLARVEYSMKLEI